MKASQQDEHSAQDHLATSRVAILGLGLMGGSLALALQGHCAQLLGYDPDPETVHMAQTQQVVEYASMQIDEILPQADLIILAAPVKQILRLLAELDDLHPDSAVVFDLGSTKRQVLAAMQALPDRFDPLGGHPICGKERSSLSNAMPDLYQEAPFVICRLQRTSDRATRLVEQLIQTIGAYPIWLEAETHDRWIAATSHLPYLLANALVQATPTDAAALIGPGFRSTTRLAAGYAPMIMDVLETNQDRILSSLQQFRRVIDQLEISLITGDWAEIESLLKESARRLTTLPAFPSTGPSSGGQPQ